jgi:hypothetical protein
MRRLGQALVVVLLIGTAHRLTAREPDLRAPDIRALRQEYAAERAALAGKRLDELRVLLKHHLAEQQRRQRQAKLSGNTTQHADAAQAVLLFTKALETLEREGTFSFPAKVRPALERMVATCTRTLASEDAAREDGFKLLDTRFAGRLQPLLVQQGITAAPEQLAKLWQAALADTGAVSSAASNLPAGEAPAGGAAAVPDGAGASVGMVTNDAVLACRGEAAAWVPVARIGIEVAAIEVISLPVADLAERVGFRGRGLESGAPWQATVTPLREFTPPGDDVAPAMRIRAVADRRPLDVLEWPGRRNGWKFELRVRPRAPGLSRHGGVLEIDAAAFGMEN